MRLWQDEPLWLRIAAHPRIFAAACAWLIVLVVLGTLAQAEIGLYQAQNRYFASWFLWLWDIPLPGGRLTLSVTGLNLLAVLFTRHGTRNPGVFLLHAGMLLLLGGGLIGGALREEGSLALAEGESGDEMSAYQRHELAIVVDGAEHDRLVTIGEGRLRPGALLGHPDLPSGLGVVDYLPNVRLRSDGRMEPLPIEKDAELNAPGVTLRLPDGRQIAICEGAAAATPLPGLRIVLRKLASRLPVGIELVKFQREDHPGTAMARSFSSEVLVHEDGGSRRVIISMNRPLRVGPWTFYQASYSEGAGGVVSVLAVVHDRFQISPYLASVVMLIGLLLHIAFRLLRRSPA